MARGKTLTQEEAERFVAMWMQRAPSEDIGKEFGMSAEAVYGTATHLRRIGAKLPRKNARPALDIDALNRLCDKAAASEKTIEAPSPPQGGSGVPPKPDSTWSEVSGPCFECGRIGKHRRCTSCDERTCRVCWGAHTCATKVG
jgi:hypothetical protein